jgi:peptide deformylase
MSIPQTKLRIRIYGDPALRKHAKPVRVVTDKDRQTLAEMMELLRFSGGIGLAAPQVGIAKQMVVVDLGNGPVIVVNPRIVRRKGSQVMEEGCLSLPGVYVKVRRAGTIIVNGLNESNEKISISAQDLLARALQHEIDHLRGRMIIDYAHLIQRIRLRKKLKNLKGSHPDELF